MQKWLFLYFILFPLLIHSYEGQDEVEKIFASVSDLSDPTLEDYLVIQDFLRNGNRPYIEILYQSELQAILVKENKIPPNAHRSMKNLQLVGYNGEMPIHELYHVNVSPEDKGRCIVIYSSYNGIYPKKARQILSELIASNYHGHILFRIGGYPNMKKGGLSLCHIPYSWKVAAICEARNLGYKNIMWVDTALHPLQSPDPLFDLIEEKGYLFLSGGVNLDYAHDLKVHLDSAIFSLGITLNQLEKIPHLTACLIGVNTQDSQAMVALDDWLIQTTHVIPCITWCPEELCYSVVAWRHSCTPIEHWGNFICTPENYHLHSSCPSWYFHLDLDRGRN